MATMTESYGTLSPCCAADSSTSAPYTYGEVTTDSTNATYTYLPARGYVPAILTYGGPIILVVGVIGNLAMFVTTLSTEMRAHSTAVYLAALAVFDTLALACLQVRAARWGTVATDLPDYVCKLVVIIMGFSVMTSSYLVTCVSLDRLIYTCLPTRAKKLCNVVVARSVAASVVIGCALVSLVTVLPFGIGLGECDLERYRQFFHVRNTNSIRIIFYPVVPTVVLLVSSAAIGWRLHHLKSPSSPAEKNARRATKIVILVSVSYLLLNGSAAAIFLLFGYQLWARSMTRVASVAGSVGTLLVMLNHATNVFLYIVVSEKFRGRMLAVLLPCRHPATGGATGGGTTTEAAPPAEGPLELYNLGPEGAPGDNEMNLSVIAASDPVLPSSSSGEASFSNLGHPTTVEPSTYPHQSRNN